MKPKRFYFRSTPLFSTPLRYGAPVFAGLVVALTGLDASARDILRPSSSSSGKSSAPGASGAALTRAATDAARANTQDILRRTGQTLDAMQAMQAAARAAAQSGPDRLGPNLPVVPNGLRPGGLNPATDAATNPASWSGASQPVETVSGENVNVTIRQTTQQALLNWQTLNVGKKTTLTFDQRAGGENVGQWIAFNRVNDPSGNPTQILGNIKADGQVYLINRNGVIFGGSSQVNARGLTVSSLPINTNLVSQGLLNNRDAQFLFSGLFVPGGADGTPDFTPEPPPASGRYGDVIVQPGAVITSPASSGGNGGRITLIGPNVTNAGSISTASGQTVLAAGLQVGVAAHSGDDPSLRGLDVWVGAVGNDGRTTNSGVIDIPTGSATLGGRYVDQLGVIDATTSVNLNGRIDLMANYGAVSNPDFDRVGGPIFFNQFTGAVTMGKGSVTRVLPDYASTKAIPGTALPERSQVNIQALTVHLDKDSIVFAPNGLVSIRAGSWPYKDSDGNRTTFDASGNLEAGLQSYYTNAGQIFYFDSGQVYIDEGATINVAGSVDVFVPLTHSILTVELRGNELADSPLQRDTNLRGAPITVDIRKTGDYNGKFWVGTPLGDVTGLAGIIERNAAQLTAVGGNINLQAGGSIVVRKGAVLDVSGGFYSHEGGAVNTSSLLLGGRKVAVKSATPDQVYDGVFTGKSVFANQKWGVTNTYTNPLTSGINQQSYQEGAGGGKLTILAPSMALYGDLRGITIEGPQQRSNPPSGSSIKISFESQTTISNSSILSIINHSPTPPDIVFSKNIPELDLPEFSLIAGVPVPLPQEQLATVILPQSLLGDEGFGSLELSNLDGSITVPQDTGLSTSPKGSILFSAANITILGSVVAPSGSLIFNVHNISPFFVEANPTVGDVGGVPLPSPAADRGLFVLGNNTRLSTAGLIADDRKNSSAPVGGAINIDGGKIAINSFSADLASGSTIDVSGGVFVSSKSAKKYGQAGSIEISTGRDLALREIIGGTLLLRSTLEGYSGTAGGSLSLQAGVIQIGGASVGGVLNLPESFFQSGGFGKYALAGIGAMSSEIPADGQFESYIPAISIVEGTKIKPFAESLIAESDSEREGFIKLRRFLKEPSLRSPVSLEFKALGSDVSSTLNTLEVRGDIMMGRGSSIFSEVGSEVSFKGQTVTLLGSVIAPGGKISVAGASSFPFTESQRITFSQALPTVHLRKSSSFSVAGAIVLEPDIVGRRIGTILDGGTISISGNILAEKGGLLDASGISGVLDLVPSVLGVNGSKPAYLVCGINIPPCDSRGAVATRLDSNGGTIDLSGSQMLLSDASLKADAGGQSASGGTLLVSSRKYYPDGVELATGADINLVVKQNGDVILNPGAKLGIGIALKDPSGKAYGNLGSFSLARFNEGGFDSLSLGGKYFTEGGVFNVGSGGNIAFDGKIDLNVRGQLRLAAGGVITADSAVSISSAYLSIGQSFVAPTNVANPLFVFKTPEVAEGEYHFAPTFGSGSLNLNASLIDLGSLSLQNIGHTSLISETGDIRGNGTLSAAGDLILIASQIYPTTLAELNLFAHDHAGGPGSVSIYSRSRSSEIPLSVGGSLSIYSSNISQNGTLKAPIGKITLGWDGTDLNPSDIDIDSPYDNIAGPTIPVPVTKKLVLGDESLTSVSAATGKNDIPWLAPFGISPNGETWTDPLGNDITLTGLPGKSISITGEDVNMGSGALVDIRGGGDLFASRWLAGIGGSMDLLGSASGAWGDQEYQPGDLVSYKNQTWSARVRHSGQTPVVGLYWSKVAESFAIVPTSSFKYAPINLFNPESPSFGRQGSALSDPGYVDASLTVGDAITLEGSKDLPAGTYTLLPRRYGLLPGAFLITPVSGGGTRSIAKADGSVLVSGYRENSFNKSAEVPAVRSRFEIASSSVIATRVEYETYTANKFLGSAAKVRELANVQELPRDGGYAVFHGNSILRLAGKLMTESAGVGAKADVSSFADISLIGGSLGNSGTGAVVKTSVLDSWGAESLLIGGIRRDNGDKGISVEVRTNALTLDNRGESFSSPDIILASNGLLTVAEGAFVSSSENSQFVADTLSVAGDGALLRVSADAGALTTRSGFTGKTSALLKVGGNSIVSGETVILDSSFGTEFAPNINVTADNLILASGQISLLLNGASGSLAGSVVNPHLVLSGASLQNTFASSSLTLRSYRSIDIYGFGELGGAGLVKLTLSGSGVRGYEQNGKNLVIRAGEVVFENSSNSIPLGVSPSLSGSLLVDANRIRLGENATAVSGYRGLTLSAASGVVVAGKGAFSTNTDLRVITPLISGEARADYSILASGNMILDAGQGTANPNGALGASLILQAGAIQANSDILFASGKLTLRATSGDLEVGGNLSVAGSSRAFNDLIRFSNGGSIALESLNGNVNLTSGANVSVAADAFGGDAGSVDVIVSRGTFTNDGKILGRASLGEIEGSEGTSGRFKLDVGSLGISGSSSFENIISALENGGFYDSRSFRIRNGDVAVANLNRSHSFGLSVDRGSILLTGSIDASGKSGGTVSLAARDNLTLASGSTISVAATDFNSAGKGGSVLLEAGTQSQGVANQNALLSLKSGSTIDLGVATYVPGSYTEVGSSAFEGKFTGTLHLRAPRTASNDDLQITSLQSTITGASSVVAEGFKVYSPSGGILNTTERDRINTDAIVFLGAKGVGNANEVAMRNKLLGGVVDPAALDSLLVIAPGAEIINATGDLILGLANNTSAGSTNPQALASADWDLSGFRYGKNSAPGVLTLRAQGDLIFNNTLSDGFTPISEVNADNGHSAMWLATLAGISGTLPTNTQSWSYRLAAGADTNSSDFRGVLALGALDMQQPSKGSVIVGEFYPAVPNSTSSGANAAVGPDGQTADTIRISTTATNRGNRFEVVRTGTGDIAISAGRDVQLRNQFSTIYTAGVALPNPTKVFSENDFVVPILPTTLNRHPNQGAVGNVTLGAIQQLYPATWSMAGGNIAISAQANIGRYTLLNGVLTVDSSRQMPTNWLFRRGYVDPVSGLFANNGGFGTNPNPNFQSATNINDQATSTTWWIDYSNFFQGIGALGGGNLSLDAGLDIINIDALAPTNARMAGRKSNPDFGTVSGAPEFINLAPDQTKLLELGGGDVSLNAGRDISGGVYYVERGLGSLFAGGGITTNAARTPSPGILSGEPAAASSSWLPTTLFVGKSHFNVSAAGDVLLGATSNPFFLPQGLNNKFWYRTNFNTFNESSGVSVSSYGGGVTHRLGGLRAWYNQNAFNTNVPRNAGRFQPWVRLNEISLSDFSTVFDLNAPSLKSTSFGGDIVLSGNLTLAPSPMSNLELVSAGGISGLSSGFASTINMSDAAVFSIRGVLNPLAGQTVTGRLTTASAVVRNTNTGLSSVNLALNETGSYLGDDSTSRRQSALHGAGLLHKNDPDPLRIYATGGDILGLTLFSPKASRIIAQKDITAVALYLQNLSVDDITLVSAGRDIVPFNANAEVGSINNVPGDIQINGPGVLEVLSGRELDLGTGLNNINGTGLGITSIGNRRNPNLPFGGSDIIVMAGVTAPNGDGPAQGLAASSLDFEAFFDGYFENPETFKSAYRDKLQGDGDFEDLSEEQQVIIGMEKFYSLLKATGDEAAKTGIYDSGFSVIRALFGDEKPVGDILTRAREIRTSTGGAISLAAPGGSITMASQIFGNPLTPPGIVTEYGGAVSTFTDSNVDIGQARIFTLRGGDITMWSSNGNLAAGTSPKTVITAPPTRVVIDITSANIQTDLGGLATGGGIGVLAAVEGVQPGSVTLIAPNGFVDAGDAGIQATGNLTIASPVVLNAGNISAGGTATGTSAPASSAPSVATVAAASNSSAASTATVANQQTQKTAEEVKPAEEAPSLITVEVIGYGGGSAEEEEEPSN